jgi:hypothetical protein
MSQALLPKNGPAMVFSPCPKQSRHIWDSQRKPELGERKKMTVCVAALFNATDESGLLERGVVSASDRMLTTGDIQYEPFKHKVGQLTPQALVMIAGDYAIHSEAVIGVKRSIAERQLSDIEDIAGAYADQLRRITTKHAVQLYLAPIGLDHDSFITNQKDMSPQLVSELTAKLQRFRLDIEAIVVGFSGPQWVRLFVIGSDCISVCNDDVGFAAIGIGAWHAKSHFMFSGYAADTAKFVDAVYNTYAAKKRAEVAPHVGDQTDIYVGMKNGFNPLIPDIRAVLQPVYERQEAVKSSIDQDSVNQLLNAWKKSKTVTPERPSSVQGPKGPQAQTMLPTKS